MLKSVFFLSAAVAQQCDLLTNFDSELWQTLQTVADTEKLHSQASSVLNMINYEPLDRCLGSIDVVEALPEAIKLMESPLLEILTKYLDTQDIQELKQHAAAVMENPMKGLKPMNIFIRNAPTERFENLCQTFDQAYTLIAQDILPVVMHILKKYTNGCCVDVLEHVEKQFNYDLEALVKTIFARVEDLLCAKRADQLCGEKFVKAMIHPTHWGRTLNNIFRVMNVPNDQACPAFMGEDFTTTDMKKAVFDDPKESWDSCSMPWDNLMSMVYSFPIIKTTSIGNIALKDFFEDGKSVEGSEIKAMVTGPFKMVFTIYGKQGFHFPNHFEQCPFTSPVELIGRFDGPAPVNPSPAPVNPAPVPVYPSPAPSIVSPAPVANPAPAPVAFPSPSPTTVAPAPVAYPTPTPTTPCPTPSIVAPAPVAYPAPTPCPSPPVGYPSPSPTTVAPASPAPSKKTSGDQGPPATPAPNSNASSFGVSALMLIVSSVILLI